MAQVLVGNEGATLLVRIVTDFEGFATAICPLCGDVDASYSLEDVIQDAKIHVERNHE